MTHRSSAARLVFMAVLCMAAGAQAQTTAPSADEANRALSHTDSADHRHDLPEKHHLPGKHHLPEKDDGPPTYFADLIAHAIQEHPSLKAREAEVRALGAQVESAGILPDPSLSLSANALPWNAPYLSADPMAHIQLGISQPLWWPGELRAMRSAAEASARALEPAVDEARVDLQLRAAELYYDIYSIDRRVEALQGLKPPIEQLIELLTTRIATGKATVSQIERARLALLKVDDDIFLLYHQRPGVVAKLNALLNRTAGSPIRPPAAPDTAHPFVVEVDPQDPLGQLDELVGRGMRTRPIVERLKLQKESAHAQAEAAAWQGYPRLEVFGSWEFYAENPPAAGSTTPLSDGTDTFSIGVRSTLPLWSGARVTTARDAASARAVAIDAEVAQFQLELRGELAEHLAELHHLYSHVQFYRDELIPQADRARTAAIAGLDAGRADFENWLAAEQRLTELHATLASLEADILKHQAMTQALIGEHAGAPLHQGDAHTHQVGHQTQNNAKNSNIISQDPKITPLNGKNPDINPKQEENTPQNKSIESNHAPAGQGDAP